MLGYDASGTRARALEAGGAFGSTTLEIRACSGLHPQLGRIVRRLGTAVMLCEAGKAPKPSR